MTSLGDALFQLFNDVLDQYPTLDELGLVVDASPSQFGIINPSSSNSWLYTRIIKFFNDTQQFHDDIPKQLEHEKKRQQSENVTAEDNALADELAKLLGGMDSPSKDENEPLQTCDEEAQQKASHGDDGGDTFDLIYQWPLLLVESKLGVPFWVVKYLYKTALIRFYKCRAIRQSQERAMNNPNPSLGNSCSSRDDQHIYDALSNELHQCTRIILLVSADHYTAWNERKRLLLSYERAVYPKGSDIEKQNTGERNPTNSTTRNQNSNRNTNNTSEYLENLTTLINALNNEVAYLNLVFSKHAKSGEAWGHRRWVLHKYVVAIQEKQRLLLAPSTSTYHDDGDTQGLKVNNHTIMDTLSWRSHYPESSSTNTSSPLTSPPSSTDILVNLLQSEILACDKAAKAHPKNYYAWTHVQWCVSHYNDATRLCEELKRVESWIFSNVGDHCGYHHRLYVIQLVLSRYSDINISINPVQTFERMSKGNERDEMKGNNISLISNNNNDTTINNNNNNSIGKSKGSSSSRSWPKGRSAFMAMFNTQVAERNAERGWGENARDVSRENNDESSTSPYNPDILASLVDVCTDEKVKTTIPLSSTKPQDPAVLLTRDLAVRVLTNELTFLYYLNELHPRHEAMWMYRRAIVYMLMIRLAEMFNECNQGITSVSSTPPPSPSPCAHIPTLSSALLLKLLNHESAYVTSLVPNVWSDTLTTTKDSQSSSTLNSETSLPFQSSRPKRPLPPHSEPIVASPLPSAHSICQGYLRYIITSALDIAKKHSLLAQGDSARFSLPSTTTMNDASRVTNQVGNSNCSVCLLYNLQDKWDAVMRLQWPNRVQTKH